MLFNEIMVVGCYQIAYVDSNYPYSCPCHLPESTVPCCIDSSYSGLAVCVAKNSHTHLIGMVINKCRYVILRPLSVIKLDMSPSLMPGAPQVPTTPSQIHLFDISVKMIETVRKRLGLTNE